VSGAARVRLMDTTGRMLGLADRRGGFLHPFLVLV
jgi:hypothetical protein